MTAFGLIVDTETGGLDQRANPLLQVSSLIFDRKLDALDQFALKVKPPANTLLQVAVPDDTSWNPKIMYLETVEGVRLACTPKGLPVDEAFAMYPIITAGAARTNGFTWAGWTDAVPLEQVSRTLEHNIRQWFTAMPPVYAHNAPFDEGYVKT